MEQEPKKKSVMRTVIVPVVVATLFAGAIVAFVPEVGWFAAISAWVGTVLFMTIWGSFYS